MLLNLPIELIIKVTQHLEFNDKATLLTTCRSLSTIVLDNSIYSELVIPKKILQGNDNAAAILQNIIQKFKSKQLNGTQVKKLVLNLNLLPDQLYYQLATIFPNVTRLVNYSGKGLAKSEPFYDQCFLQWKNSFEKYDILDGHFQIPYLLEKNTFPHLTHLCIAPYFDFNDTIFISGLQIIDCIKNAPSLVHLFLHKSIVNITFLETLHRNCSHLRSLALGDALISTSDDKLPDKLVPATSMLCLDVGRSTLVCDANCTFLDYIIAKYPFLEQLSYFSTFNKPLLNQFFPNESEERRFNNLVFLALYADLDITKTVHLKEGPRLLKRLPRSLKSLKIYTHIFENIMELLEKSDINPESLAFFETNHYGDVLRKPNDFEYLQKLSALKTMQVALNDIFPAYNNAWSISLTTLRVSIEGNSPEKNMDFSRLLNMFPLLQELYIRYSGAKFVIGDFRNKIHYNLKKVDLGYSSSDTQLLHFLSFAAPNLKELCYYIFGNAIKTSIEKERMAKPLYIHLPLMESTLPHYKVDLSGFNLDLLQLWIQLGDTSLDIKCRVLFEIIMRGKVKMFIFSEAFTQISVIHNVNDESIKTMSKVTVVCDRINRIKINHAICVDLKDSKLYLDHI